MGLREEIREELEEKERNRNETTTSEEIPDDERDLHGIGWNIMYNKFIRKD